MTWLLLILSLPTASTATRMRAWRALKGEGAAVLRDGVHLLPTGEARREALARVAADVEASGGHAHLLEVTGADHDFAALFDRSEEYARLTDAIAACATRLETRPTATEAAAAGKEAGKEAGKLRRSFAAIVATDFFPGQVRDSVAARLDALEALVRARLNPDEPTPGPAAIRRHAPGDFRGRVWATRRRPWVDRLASAWLIRRFIDPAARLLWLARPAECPPTALGFDFDGATFSHVGDKVTFETLLASFGLEADRALARLGRIVHYLDAGGLPVAEAAGLETLLAGMRSSLDDDDALLAAAGQAFDFFYTHFQTGEPDHA